MQAQTLWNTGFVAPRHVESSQTRDQTRVPCTGRQILIIHCTTREVPLLVLSSIFNHQPWKVVFCPWRPLISSLGREAWCTAVHGVAKSLT